MTDSRIYSRVVVVEDEAIIAMLIEDMLTDLGHQVAATVGKTSRAHDLFTADGADFAILDVNLGGEQTFGLAAILRERGVPFIFATGYGNVGLPKEWQGTPTLQKPFQMQDLREAMRAAEEVDPTEGRSGPVA